MNKEIYCSTVLFSKRQDQDLLTQYGFCEEEIKNMDNFLSLSAKLSEMDSIYKKGKIIINSHSMNLAWYTEPVPPITMYLASEIESLEFYKTIRQWDKNALLITSYVATHFANPADYIKPVFEYLIR